MSNKTTNTRIELGRGYLLYRFVVFSVVPSGIAVAAILISVHNLALAVTLSCLIIAANIWLLSWQMKQGHEYVECDSAVLKLMLNDYQLTVELAEIASIRVVDSSTNFTDDGNDLCEEFGIYMKGGQVHIPPPRPGLLQLIRHVSASHFRGQIRNS